MHEKIIPYTEKYPFMYQLYLQGYMIQTTNEETFEKCKSKALFFGDSYADWPKSLRMQIESVATVKKTSMDAFAAMHTG